MTIVAPAPAPALRERRRLEARRLLRSEAAREALAHAGTPLLLLEPDRVRAAYRRLATAFPRVRFHYAIKALAHDAVIDAVDAEGGCFDVASTPELDLLVQRGIPASRIIHTHPVKKIAEIDAAIAAGVHTFVIDRAEELAKFAGRDVRLLIRLAYRNPSAKSDLSAKFGVGPFEARRLVELAIAQRTAIAGFSFHVGSQLDDPARFRLALAETITLMDRLEADLPVRFELLDIGGGFPVAYDAEVNPVEVFADALRPLLDPLAGRLDVIAEPGRFVVAEAMTLVTSVMGRTERPDGRWYHLDDGVYVAYSNVVSEDARPLLFAASELRHGSRRFTRRWATVAGPTCDSADVVAREALLPDLAAGDLVVSPVMGAYTAVTASGFNGRPPTPIAVVSA